MSEYAREVAPETGETPFRVGDRVQGQGFTGTLEGHAAGGEFAVIAGDDGISSRRIRVQLLQHECAPALVESAGAVTRSKGIE